jgi:hypothetical protein
MATTYEPIATTTLSTGASTITFSSIPSTYTDIRLVFALNTSSNNRAAYLRLNADTGTNYSQTFLSGDGTDALSSRYSNATVFYFTDGGQSSTVPTFCTLDIFSYAGSTNKTALQTVSGDKNGSGWVHRVVGLYRSTSAITEILITTLNADTFNAGTVATLYGIKNA